MIDYAIVGSRIRKFRSNQGITQEELAFRINTSTSYISNIERGIKKPSLQKLIEIAEAIHVTINELIYDPASEGDIYFDKELIRIIACCDPEKQKKLTKSIADIIQIIITD